MKLAALALLVCSVISAQPPSSNARTVGGKPPCSATRTTNCIPSADASGNVAISTTVLGPYTISAGASHLPAAAAGNTGWLTRVTDTINCVDAAVGVTLCMSSGSAWAPVSGSSYTLPAATNSVTGGVTMSTATSSVAVATDDARLGSPVTTTCMLSVYITLDACLDAAKAIATTNEAGAGHAVKVLLQEGVWTLTAHPYALLSGLQIEGIMPRLQKVPGQAPDLTMTPNGGTWIDCGAGVCFNGSDLNGVSLVNLGFKNFTKALSFGGDSAKGLAFSELRNLTAIGNTTVGSSTVAWELFNSQHVRGDFLNAYHVITGLAFIEQDNAYQYGNSVFSDLYTLAYPKSAASGNNTLTSAGMLFDVRTPATGTAQAMSYVDVYRPQINAYDGDGTGYFIAINGIDGARAVGVNLHNVDIEGTGAYGIYLNYEANSFITLTQAAGTNTFYQASEGGNSTIFSEYSTATVYNGTGTNVYYGQYAAQASPNPMRGAYWLSTPYGFYVQTELLNGLAVSGFTQTIASGTTAATGAGSINNLGSISTATCATLTVTAANVAATDVIGFTPSGSIQGLAGFAPATTGGLTIAGYPTTGNVVFDVCNWTSGSITPGQVRLNWRVTR